MRDAIVIGAGHNGLVAGLHLARAGRRVTIAERSGEVGGLCAPSALHPGYRIPGLLHDGGGCAAASSTRWACRASGWSSSAR